EATTEWRKLVGDENDDHAQPDEEELGKARSPNRGSPPPGSLVKRRQPRLENPPETPVVGLIRQEPPDQGDLARQVPAVDLAPALGHRPRESAADLPGALEEDPVEPRAEPVRRRPASPGVLVDDRLREVRGHPV